MSPDANRLDNWVKYSKKNWYYHKSVKKLLKNIIPRDASVLEFGSRLGEVLKAIPNKNKVGVEFDSSFITKNRNGFRILNFKDVNKKIKGKKFEYIVLSNVLSETDNIQDFLRIIKKYCRERTRIVVLYFNYFWKPFLDFGELVGLKNPNQKEPNWLSSRDIENFFELEDFQSIKNGGYFLFPYSIPLISDFINKYLSNLPIINNLCLLNYSVFRSYAKPHDCGIL